MSVLACLQATFQHQRNFVGVAIQTNQRQEILTSQELPLLPCHYLSIDKTILK